MRCRAVFRAGSCFKDSVEATGPHEREFEEWGGVGGMGSSIWSWSASA